MNILFLLRYFPYFGGGESVTVRLANEFQKRNHKVFVTYLKYNEAPFDIYLEEGVKLYLLENQIDYSMISSLQDEEFQQFYNGLESIVCNEQIDIIINQWWPSKLVYKATQKKAYIIKCHHSAIIVDSRRKEFLVRCFGKGIYRFLLFSFLRYKYKNDLKYSNKFVVLGKALIDDLEKLYGKKYEKKVISIPNPSKYSGLKPEQYEKEKCAVYVGRFSKEKRIEKIVTIWSNLSEQGICDDWTLYLVGNGDTYNYISELVNNIGIKNIVLMGTSDPLEIYEKSRILLLTSSYEGFSMVVVEAMQNACVPVVMNTYSNCKEIVTDGYDGVLTEDDDNKFEAKLKMILKDDKKMLEMSKNAVHSSKRFEIAYIANIWDKLFESVVR